MKVSAWRRELHGGRIRLAVEMQWEDSARTETLWFDWREADAAAVRPTADAALLLAYPLAMSYGERRLLIDGEISPRLAEGARVAMAVIATQDATLRPVALELRTGWAEAQPAAASREMGLCLSGGVDALAALQERQALPASHPMRYRHGIFAFGFNTYDFVGGAIDPARLAAAESYADRLETFAVTQGLALTRVRTNYRTLHRSFDAWAAVAHDSHLAAIGHLMRPRLRALSIGSAGAGLAAGIPQDPLLVALYATDDLDVHGAQPMRSRLEKLRALLAWPEALEVLRVCFLMRTPGTGERNCGSCEKCVRTALQCIALGAGDRPAVRAAFTTWPGTPEALARVDLRATRVQAFYAELAPLLAAQGRADLARAISAAIAPGRGGR